MGEDLFLGGIPKNELLFFYIMWDVVSNGNLHAKSNGIVVRSLGPPREEFL